MITCNNGKAIPVHMNLSKVGEVDCERAGIVTRKTQP